MLLLLALKTGKSHVIPSVPTATAFYKPGHKCVPNVYPSGTPGHRALNRDCPGQIGTFGQLGIVFV